MALLTRELVVAVSIIKSPGGGFCRHHPTAGVGDTHVAEHVVTGGSVVGSGQFAAQAHFTEVACQANGRLTLELETAIGCAAGLAITGPG